MAGNSKGAIGKTDMWDRLKTVDPAATKPFDRGTYRGTMLDPTWRYRRMTEEFGSHGKGWGYEQLDWTVTDGMVFICVRCWYIDPETGEQTWTGPQWGGDSLTKGKGRLNDEAFKMAMTDAIGKCLVPIGLAADLYMGKFDDSKYREEMSVLYELKSEWPDDRIEKFEADSIADIVQIDTVAEIDAYYKRPDFRESLRCVGVVDKAAKARIMEALSDRKRELVEIAEAERRATKSGKGQQPAATADEPADDASEPDGYEGSIQQQADQDQAEFTREEAQRQEEPAQQAQAEEQARKPAQAPVYEFDVADYVTREPKTLAVQLPDEEEPNWERYTIIALKIVQNFPNLDWGAKWMGKNGYTIDNLEKQGVIMERDGVKYTGAQAAHWIDKAHNKRVAELQGKASQRGERQRERAGAD